MGKIMYMAPVEAMSGKFAKQATKINEEKNGVQYFTGNYWIANNWKYFGLRNVVNPRVLNPTDSQVAKQNKFKNTITAIKQAKSNPSEWEAIKEGFKAQTKYKLLWNYAFSVLYPTVS